MDSIFLSIASYRDPELLKTITSAIINADIPSRVTIGVCDQHEIGQITPFEHLMNVKVYRVPWNEVEGSVCWARKLIQQKFFEGQDWFFQVDSHTQFSKGWDTRLIKMYESIGKKCVISVGPPYYHDPSTPGHVPPHNMSRVEERNGMYFETTVRQQKLDMLHPGGSFMYGFVDAEDTSKPFLGRHISAALLFAPGQWVEDVPYDSEIYFHGEEGNLALRSWTNGYDIYNPNELIIWHLNYDFPTRKRHWTDFSEEDKHPLEVKSYKRYEDVLFSEDSRERLGKLGLGDERSMKEWEIYSGVDYKNGVAHPDVYLGKIPNPVTVKTSWEEWVEYKKKITNERN